MVDRLFPGDGDIPNRVSVQFPGRLATGPARSTTRPDTATSSGRFLKVGNPHPRKGRVGEDRGGAGELRIARRNQADDGKYDHLFKFGINRNHQEKPAYRRRLQSD